MVDESLSERRSATLARLAASRAEIRRVLEPKPNPAMGEAAGVAGDGAFPRSRTMKLLMSGRGVGTVGAVLGGLLISRPVLALKLLRLLPTGAVARMLLVRGISALRSKHD